MTSRLLLDRPTVYWPISKRKTWRVKRRLSGITRDDWRYLNRILILSLFGGLVITVPAFHIVISLCKNFLPGFGEFPPKYSL